MSPKDEPGKPRKRVKDVEAENPPPLVVDATTPARASTLAKRRAERASEDEEKRARLAQRRGKAPRKLSGKTRKAKVVGPGSYKLGTKLYRVGATVEAPVEDVEELACLEG